MLNSVGIEILKDLREEIADKNKAKNGIEYCIKIENQLDAIDYAIAALDLIGTVVDDAYKSGYAKGYIDGSKYA